MSEDVINPMPVKLGVTVDQASFDDSTQAVDGLSNAINQATRGVEEAVGRLDKTVIRAPRSADELKGHVADVTQKVSSFRSDTQPVVDLLSHGAKAAGLGPLAETLPNMFKGGGPLSVVVAGVDGLASNASAYASGALTTELNASTYGVTLSDFQNFNRFGRKVTGSGDVGTQILQAAQKIKMGSAVGNIPTEISGYGGSPEDFKDASRRPTLEVVDTIRNQLIHVSDPLMKQGLGSSLGLGQAAIMTLGEDYRTGMAEADRPGSTYTDQDVANARAFQNSLVNLTTEFDRLSNRLGAAFLPALDNFVKGVDGFFSEGGASDKYLDAFGKLADGDIKGFVKSFGEAEKSTPVISEEQNKFMTNWLMENIPFDKLAHYTYDGAVKGYEKGGIKGAIAGAREGFDASPVVANSWLDRMTSDGWESIEQSVYTKMPSAHVDDDLSKPLRAEYLPREKPQKAQLSKTAFGSQNDTQGALKHFMDNGYTREQSSGIVGNLIVESGLNTDAVGDNGQAYGLAQWHPRRQQTFKDVQGRDIRGSTRQEQLDFILYELQSTEKAAGVALSKTKTASEAARVIRDMYERAAANPEDVARRVRIAEQLNSGTDFAISATPNAQMQAAEQKVPALVERRTAPHQAPSLLYTTIPGKYRLTDLLSSPTIPRAIGPDDQWLPANPAQRDRWATEALINKTRPIADQSSPLPVSSDLMNLPYRAPTSDVLPANTPETYNMITHPPAPPMVDARQASISGTAGNVVHIDARGSTDVQHITREAMRAASDHFQGQMTVAMSHFSKDLDQ